MFHNNKSERFNFIIYHYKVWNFFKEWHKKIVNKKSKDNIDEHVFTKDSHFNRDA